MGVFSSAHCVPMAQKVDAAKRFMWANVCVASAVFKDKKLTNVFRAQVHSDQFGEASCTFLNEQAKARLGKDPKDLKYGVSITDACLGWEVTERMLRHGAEALRKAGVARTSAVAQPV
jgi:branched-chain amino acid transport system substrate-binding protein